MENLKKTKVPASVSKEVSIPSVGGDLIAYRMTREWNSYEVGRTRSTRLFKTHLAIQSESDRNIFVMNCAGGLSINPDYSYSRLISLPMNDTTVTTLEMNSQITPSDASLLAMGLLNGKMYILDPIGFVEKRKQPKLFSCFHQEEMDGKAVNMIRWIPYLKDEFFVIFRSGLMLHYSYNREEDHEILHGIASWASNNASSSLYQSHLPGTRSHELNRSTPELTWKMTACHGAGEPQNPINMINFKEKFTINDLKFSPACNKDSTIFAMACSDGWLRVYDYTKKKAIVAFQSFYGGFTRLDWSFDGKYIAAGSEDDLLSIYDVQNYKICCRGEGHISWITGIVMDPELKNESEKNNSLIKFNEYCATLQPEERKAKERNLLNNRTIVTSGEDTRLLVWSFDVLDNERRLCQVNSFVGDEEQDLREESDLGGERMGGTSMSSQETDDQDEILPITVSCLAKGDVPVIDPIHDFKIHQDNVTSMRIMDGVLFTTCGSGWVRQWQPLAEVTSGSRSNALSPKESDVDPDEEDFEDEPEGKGNKNQAQGEENRE